MGDHYLTLRSGERTTELGHRVARSDAWTEPRALLVSPDGQRLAYRGDAGALHVRDARGRQRTLADVGDREARFSPDGRTLAAFRGEGDFPLLTEVVVLDLVDGGVRVLGEVRTGHWMEWTADGLVVLADNDRGGRSIDLYPTTGEVRELAAVPYQVSRFAAGGRGHRVVYVAGDRTVWSLPTDGRAARPLGDGLGPWIDKLAASPDGERVAIVSEGIHLIEGDAAPKKVANDLSAHSVWFSTDGARLAFATIEGAVVLEGNRRHRFASTANELRTMRLAGDGDGIIVLDGARAIRWRPGTRGSTALASAAADSRVLAAEVFAGGTVILTRRERPYGHDEVLPMLDPFAALGDDGLVDEDGRSIKTGKPVLDRSSATIVPATRD